MYCLEKNFIMAYTVISVFPATVDTEEIKKDLKNQGFDEANIIISTSKLEDDPSAGNYVEDVQTKNFWNYVFAHDVEMLEAYSKGSVGKNTIVVYADTIEEAQRAKTILNEKGAIEIFRRQPEDRPDSPPPGMTQEEYNGIIAKARHNIYFLGSERVYHSNEIKGMDDEMDSLGSKD